MRTGPQLPVAASALAVALLAGSPAHTEDRSGALRIEYTAPSVCPAEAELLRQVQARTPKAVVAQSGERAYAFRVTLELVPQGASLGRLTIVDPDGIPSEREVKGSDCGEVVAAIALIAAVVIDPNASTGTLDPVQQTPASMSLRAPAPFAPAPSAPPEAPAPAAPARPTPAPPAFPPPSRAPKAPPRPSATAARRPTFGLGAGAVTAGAVAPTLSYGGAIYVELDWRGAGVFEPVVGVSALRTVSPTAATSLGDASFTWTAARLAGCPVRRQAGELTFRPCVAFELGQLEGRGSRTHAPATAGVLWLANDVSARVEWAPIPQLIVRLEAWAVLPWIRDRFLFLPGVVAHAVPAVSAGGQITGGVHFP